MHPAGHQLHPLKVRGHPVEHMVSCLLHIIRHQIFEGEHPLHIHIAGAGDQILLVGVLSSQLVADEVTAVIEVVAVHHAVVADSLPAGGLYLTDGASFLRGHQLRADVGIGRAASAQSVQLSVGLKGLCGQLAFVKARNIAVYDGISLSCVVCFNIHLEVCGKSAGGQKQGEGEKEQG